MRIAIIVWSIIILMITIGVLGWGGTLIMLAGFVSFLIYLLNHPNT